ncbi:MAG: zinc ribbon domain-containing protein [Dehalococcoidia bacterium]
MPIYDYRCRDCGEVHEVFLRSAENDPTGCPSCGSGQLERLFTSFHVLGQSMGGGDTTCCGRDSRCDSPPCSVEGVCRRT